MTRLRLIAWIILPAAGLGCLLAAAACGGSGEAEGLIAFQSDRDGTTDLYLIRRDGTGLRRLTDLAEDDPSVAWSPEGRWVAFQGGSGIHVVDVATTALYLLSETVGFGGMDWAP